MESVAKRGVTVSRLTLGTVQLGLRYGLREDAAAPDADAAARVFSLARSLGVTAWDTARAYGDAEEKLGLWLDRAGTGSDVIVTKISDLDHAGERALLASMRAQVLLSCERLRLPCIPVVMLHHWEEYAADRAAIDRAFACLKQEGLIRLCGVSAYATHDWRDIAACELDAVQIPVNYLDWAQIDRGGLEALRRADKLVFARSVYLQGLLLRTPETLEARMRYAAPVLAGCARAAEAFGLTQKQLALRFALSLPGVDSLVLGCRDEAQLRDNCRELAEARPLSEAQMEQLRVWFSDTPRKISLPMLWPRD